MGRACSTNGQKKNEYRICVGKPGRKRPLGRLRLKWVHSIKINLKERECGGMDWIDQA
jgi:hypothetical protein